MSTSKFAVMRSLLTLRRHRPRHLADRMIRSVLVRFGNGATSLSDLRPQYYANVIAAVSGTGAVDYSHGPRQQEFRSRMTRPRSRLVVDLERQLRAGATPRHSRRCCTQ